MFLFNWCRTPIVIRVWRGSYSLIGSPALTRSRKLHERLRSHLAYCGQRYAVDTVGPSLVIKRIANMAHRGFQLNLADRNVSKVSR